MKLNFTNTIWEVIEKVVASKAIPYSLTAQVNLRSLVTVPPAEPKIAPPLTHSNREKYRSRIRRELAFLKYIFNHIAAKRGVESDPALIYQDQISTFETIYTEKFLNNPQYVKLGLFYGVILLSSFEISRLISGNHFANNADVNLVQVAGCRRDGEEVYPFMSHAKAEFYGVYIGRPGRYVHVIDHPTYQDALHAAAGMVTDGKAAAIDDATFND